MRLLLVHILILFALAGLIALATYSPTRRWRRALLGAGAVGLALILGYWIL